MTYDEMIAVLQAAKEGKVIQCRTIGAMNWHDIPDPKWTFSFTEYRVKPEPPKPREWWVAEVGHQSHSQLDMQSASQTKQECLDKYMQRGNTLRIVLFREVLEGQE